MAGCKVDKCANRVVARGLCDKHRKRMARHGRLDAGRPDDWGKRGSHPLYKLWNGMMRRCYEKVNKNYINYGARGIVVCDRWHDFWLFVADMGARPSKTHSVGRKNNNGPYSPQNCRWETPTQQARNRSNSVITAKLAAEIKRRHAFGDKAGDIARAINLDYDHVRNVIIGVSWGDI